MGNNWISMYSMTIIIVFILFLIDEATVEKAADNAKEQETADTKDEDKPVAEGMDAPDNAAAEPEGADTSEEAADTKPENDQPTGDTPAGDNADDKPADNKEAEEAAAGAEQAEAGKSVDEGESKEGDEQDKEKESKETVETVVETGGEEGDGAVRGDDPDIR